MIRRFTISISLLLFVTVVSAQTRKVIISEHSNGKPHVVFTVKKKGNTEVKIKEECYYENGKLEYEGEVKDDVEHGVWKYYYEDGTIKAIEYWKNGKEDGTWKEFFPDGRLAREIIYKNGEYVQTITH